MKEKKITDAKEISKWAIVVSVLIAIVYNISYTITSRQIPTIEQQSSIIMLCTFIIVAFSPVYLSIILDKFVKKDKE